MKSNGSLKEDFALSKETKVDKDPYKYYNHIIKGFSCLKEDFVFCRYTLSKDHCAELK